MSTYTVDIHLYGCFYRVEGSDGKKLKVSCPDDLMPLSEGASVTLDEDLTEVVSANS